MGAQPEIWISPEEYLKMERNSPFKNEYYNGMLLPMYNPDFAYKMGSAHPSNLISPEEYLEIEREASFKSEFFNGQVYAMAGGSLAHNNICGNVFAFLYNNLKGKGCRPSNSDQRIKIPEWPSYSYPDISVTCGEPILIDEDNISNPVVIFEVQSDSTKVLDFTVKFGQYRQIQSLKEYVLVSTTLKQVTKFWRYEGTDVWNESVYDLSNNLPLKLDSIHLTLPLEDIYYNIELDAHLSIR